MPMKSASVPTPSSGSVWPVLVKSPMPRRITPSAAVIAPPMMRRRVIGWASGTASRRAAIGVTRVARRAGRMAATRVTTVPTTIETMMLRGVTVRPPLVREKPSRRARPTARRTPRAAPIAEATTPVMKASMSTDTITCRRVAPRARRSASSRDRWAMRMVNVLTIRKEPTKSAIRPNTNSAVLRMLMIDCVACFCWLACALPVWATMLAGSTAAMRSRSVVSLTPDAESTAIWSKLPWVSSTRIAVGVVNNVMVAPATLSADPYPAMPLTWNG